MDTKGQLEKVLQYLLNEEEDKAVDLLKKVFIQKGRSINEQIMAEEEDVVEKILDDAECRDEMDEDRDSDRMRDMQGEVKSEEYFGEGDEGDEGEKDDQDGDELDSVLSDAQNSLAHLQQLFDEIHSKLADQDGESEEGSEDTGEGDDETGETAEVEIEDEVKESMSDEEEDLDEAAILEFSILDESVAEDLPLVKMPANKHDLAGAKTGDTEKLNPNTTSPVGKKGSASPAVIKKPSEAIPAVGEKQDGAKVSGSGVKSNFVRKSAMDNTKPVK